MRRTVRFPTVCVILGFLCGSHHLTAWSDPAVGAKETAAGLQAFALDLYQGVALKPNRGNIVVSPYSVAASLALVSAGARGETLAEMHDVLHVTPGECGGTPLLAGFDELTEAIGTWSPDLRWLGLKIENVPGQPPRIVEVADKSPLKAFCKVGETVRRINGRRIADRAELAKALAESTESIDLEFADGRGAIRQVYVPVQPAVPCVRTSSTFWIRKGCSLRPGFSELLTRDGRTKVAWFDPADAERVAQLLNEDLGLAATPKGRQLLKAGDVEGPPPLVVTNATRFTGSWRLRFDEACTDADGKFFGAPGRWKTVPMMHVKSRFAMVRPAPTFRVIELPYRGEKFAMVVALPDAVDGLPSLERTITVASLRAWQDQLDAAREQPAEVRLSMPRFSFEQLLRLSPVLTGLGMVTSFSEAADFSGVTSDASICLSEVLHRAFIAVDERGTDAGGATAVISRSIGVDLGPSLEFRIDRPFMFFIRDRASRAVLFVGRVVDIGADVPSGRRGG